MKILLFENEAHQFDPSFRESLDALGETYSETSLPDDHERMAELIEIEEAAAIFLPADWEDLFSVKLIDEIEALMRPFETVMVGPVPESDKLTVAYNNGLTAFLKTPVTPELLRRILGRVEARLNRKVKHERLVKLLQQYESSVGTDVLNPQMIDRDQRIGQAMMHLVDRSGPLGRGEVEVLLISSSTAQQQQLSNMLGRLSINLTTVGTMQEGLDRLRETPFEMVLFDSVLPDGDAASIAKAVHGVVKGRIPRLVVWSSSPDKAPGLLSPENQIDALILKPAPHVGIESVLPTILAELYQHYT